MRVFAFEPVRPAGDLDICNFIFSSYENQKMSSTMNLQKFAEAASANSDAFKSIYDLTLSATQQVFSLNSDLIRSFTESQAFPKNAADFREQASAQAQNFERFSEYFRNVTDIFTKTQVEVFKLGSQNAEEVAKILSADLETLFKSFPVDSSRFAEVLTSALSSATTTYEKFVDTSRQFTESSLLAATQAGQAAANSAAAPAKAIKKSA